ncbi:MAG: hypothetical protein KAS32_06710 [Candidatus Peribacteraceae bacterium]|nr:hypothetical protein [Candidatus Peribacteraceae bacterium]
MIEVGKMFDNAEVDTNNVGRKIVSDKLDGEQKDATSHIIASIILFLSGVCGYYNKEWVFLTMCMSVCFSFIHTYIITRNNIRKLSAELLTLNLEEGINEP